MQRIISLSANGITNEKMKFTVIRILYKERSNLNVHFKKCMGTYVQVFDKMLESGIISIWGLKPDADVFGEMIFDINTMYFEKHGGYEYAKEFKEVVELAKEGIASRSELNDMHRRLHGISMRLLDWKNSYDQLYEQTKDFRQAVKLAPQRVKDTFAEIFANDREQREMKKAINRSSLKRNNRNR